jgi:hypothetical protein
MSWLNVQHRVNATANIAVVGVIVLVIVFPFRVGLLSLPYTIYYNVLPM